MENANLKAKLGVALLLTVFSLNAIYAFNDYGVTENKLHNEVIAQRNSSTDGGAAGGASVACCCGAIWGAGCKADNHGSTCATTEKCWQYDKNCSD